MSLDETTKKRTALILTSVAVGMFLVSIAIIVGRS